MSTRRSIYGVALAAFFALLAVCAVGATAALGAEETPEWQQGKAKLSEAAKTKSKGNIRLYDKGAVGEVECESTGEGTAGPGAVDKTTSWTLSNCKATPKALNKNNEEKTNACEKAEGASITKLPWEGVLEFGGGKTIFNKIDTFEFPGFIVHCEFLKVKVTDTCEAAPTVPIIGETTNVTGGVDEAYDAGGFACSVGGSDAGTIVTTQFVEATKGSALEANLV